MTARRVVALVREALEVAAACVEYPLARADVARRYDASTLESLLLGVRPTKHLADGTAVAIQRATDALDRALRFVPLLPKTCLYRSAAQFRVLRRRGADVRFVMGLRDPAASSALPDGHAWIEIGARTDAAMRARFVMTYSVP